MVKDNTADPLVQTLNSCVCCVLLKKKYYQSCQGIAQWTQPSSITPVVKGKNVSHENRRTPGKVWLSTRCAPTAPQALLAAAVQALLSTSKWPVGNLLRNGVV